MSQPNDDDRRALLKDLREQFGVELGWHEATDPDLPRKDISMHIYLTGVDPEPTEATKREVRRWLEGRGWQCSRQRVPVGGPDHRVEYVFPASMIVVPLRCGYHATPCVSVPSILAEGLLPGTAERQTSAGRWDCEGNIDVCADLGTPADAGVRGTMSAHWWRDHLARNNRFGDRDWVILEIDFGDLPVARAYRDLWSNSGLIVDGVESIPPRLIHPLWESDGILA